MIGIYVLITVVAFLFGALVLILATGYRRHEPTTREEGSRPSVLRQVAEGLRLGLARIQSHEHEKGRREP